MNGKESGGMSILAVPPSTASLEAFAGGGDGVEVVGDHPRLHDADLVDPIDAQHRVHR